MHLLFITSNRLGDAILSTGILNQLIHDFPSGRLTIAASPLVAPLFKHIPNLERLILFQKKSHGRHWGELWSACFLKRWDLVVDVRGSLLSYFLKVGRRYVWRSQLDDTLHRVEALAGLLKLNHVPAPKIWTSSEYMNHIHKRGIKKQKGETLVAFGMGANWSGKTWPLTFFIQLAQKIQAASDVFPKCRFLLLGSKDEKSLGVPFQEAFPKESVIDVIGDLDLLSVHTALQESSFFIGNDSGLMHLSAAAQTPTIGLFGPSYPQHYRPWGEKATYVTTDVSYNDLVAMPEYKLKAPQTLMTSLSVEKVFGALVQHRKHFKT